MFELYEKFLESVEKTLAKMYEEQKGYVFCKAGCDKCCSLGEYPLSRFEFQYLMQGFELLNQREKKIVKFQIQKLKKIYERKKNKEPKPFEHACPFLVDSLCSVYKYRPLICRTFGLIKLVKTIDEQAVLILPDCVNEGLNYSNVIDMKNNCFDEKKIEELNFDNPPKPYDISLPVLIEQCEDKNIDFKDRKNMIEFLNDITL